MTCNKNWNRLQRAPQAWGSLDVPSHSGGLGHQGLAVVRLVWNLCPTGDVLMTTWMDLGIIILSKVSLPLWKGSFLLAFSLSFQFTHFGFSTPFTKNFCP